MKKYIFGITLLIFFAAIFFLYKQLTYTHISVSFKDIRPFDSSIPVYYKGIVIGKATDRRHTNDYKNTVVKVVLYPKNLHLPVNTKVLLKKEKKNKKEYDFLELIYPENPSEKLITNGTWLEGKTTVDIETFMRNQNPEDLEGIRANLASASENLNMSLEAIGQLFVILQEMVKENQPNLLGTTGNIKQATGNINQATAKFNNSIKEQQLSNTFTNIETSTTTIQRITDSVYGTAVDINKSIPGVNSTLNSTRELINNANTISCGVRQTLRKPFGGLRLIFGKTIKEDNCKTCGQ